MTKVAVDDERLCYHHQAKLATTRDMDIIPEDDAIEDGAVACSECFEWQDGVMYDFAYLDGGAI